MRFSNVESNGLLSEKKSRFLSFVIPVIAEEKHAMNIKDLKKRYHDASHICFAFRIMKDHQVFERSSDAGEPSGSAGKPLLNLLKSHELVQTGLYVIRYYGGIPLGIPGLIHAYSQAGLIAIESNNAFQIFQEFERKHEKIAFSYFQIWKNQLEKMGGKILHMQSSDGVEVEYEVPSGPSQNNQTLGLF